MLQVAFFAEAVGRAIQLAGSMPEKVDICRKLSGALVRALKRLAVEVSSSLMDRFDLSLHYCI